jgi:hypothetical protein
MSDERRPATVLNNDGILINLISCADSHPRRKDAPLTSACSWAKPRFPPKPLPLGGTVLVLSLGPCVDALNAQKFLGAAASAENPGSCQILFFDSARLRC